MSQRLEKSYGLNETQLAQIRHLEAACNRFEELTMKLNWSRLQQRPANEINDFLFYEGGELRGYLALYHFNGREAEVSAMTQPEYRRRGLFKQLLAAARAELSRRGIPDLLFICEQPSESGQHCLAAIGATYEFSEYKMNLQQWVQPPPLSIELQLRPAQLEDVEDLARMDELCFETSFIETKRHLERDLVDQRRRTLVATAGPIKIGKIGVLMAEEESYIYAFCVLPGYRRRGYGKMILTRTVEQLVAEGWRPISLEVACANEQALGLYQQCGFQVVTAYDYYRLPVGAIS